jgi:hypothetical protein
MTTIAKLLFNFALLAGATFLIAEYNWNYLTFLVVAICWVDIDDVNG